MYFMTLLVSVVRCCRYRSLLSLEKETRIYITVTIVIRRQHSAISLYAYGSSRQTSSQERRMKWYNIYQGNSRLRPWCIICCHCIRRGSQTACAPWRIGGKLMSFNLVMCIRPVIWNDDVIHKPEVHNVLHRRQKKTDTATDTMCSQFHDV